MAGFTLSAPNASAYGVFSPTYAQSLSQPTGNAGADVLNQFVLMMLANKERGGYSEDLRYVNDLAAKQAEADRFAEMDKARLNNLANQAQAGVSGAVESGYKSPYVTFNQDHLKAADTVQLDREGAAAANDMAQAITYLTAADFRPTQEEAGRMMAGALDEQPLNVQPYVTFSDQSDRIRANAAMENAKAAMVSARRPTSEGGVTVTYEPGLYGLQSAPTIKGKSPQAVKQAVEEWMKLNGTGGGTPTAGETGGDDRRVRIKPGTTNQFQRKNAKGEWVDVKQK